MKFIKRFRKKNDRPKEIKKAKPVELPPVYTSDWSPEQTEQVIAETTNPAFLEAWRMHWMDLDESEKVEWSFRDVRSPLKVQKTIEDMDKLHREHSISRKIATKTLRFLQALETLMAGAAIGIQASPDVSAIVVGVVRVVINVAVKYFEYYEKLSQMLERLAEHIVILDLFTQNNSDEQILHRTLVALYRNILAFCRYARRAFVIQGDSIASNGLAMFARVQWAPFEQQFGQIQSNLEHYTKNLGMVSTAMTLNSTLAIRDDLKKKRSLDLQQERKNFLDWICQDVIEEIHGIIRQKRHADTGLWLLEHHRYKSWVSEKTAHPLWLSGPAGTGKSVLASMVIDHLKDHKKYPDYTVAYMYFKGEEVNTKHLPTRTMSMLVKQLCWNLETLPEQTLQLFRDFEKNARQPTFEDLKSVFIDCAGYLGTVVVVFDAFDECEGKFRKQLSTFAREIVTQCNNVKVFVTSRWERDIQSSLKPPLITHQIDMKPSAQDIAKTVRHRVMQEFKHIRPDLREKIINQLVEKSAGSFLWVDLQLNDLVQIPQSDIETQLTMLPSGLSDTYIECLRRINAQPRANRLLAQNCFTLALYSYKLIHRDPFLDILSLQAKLSGNGEIAYSWLEIGSVTNQLIISPGIWGRVRPLHFSFKEFMVNPECPIPAELQDYFPDSETAHARLAIMCLQHLMTDAPLSHVMDTGLFYCGRYFDHHIRELTTIPDELMDLLDRLFNDEPHRLLKILAWRWPIAGDSFPDIKCGGSPSSMDPVFFMQCTKLDQVPAIWSRYSNVEPLKTYPEGYLSLAVIAGLEGHVREMIAQGADVNRLDADQFVAIHFACSKYCHAPFEMLKILVDEGADINMRAKDGHSPLRMARDEGLVEVVEFLEQRGALES